METKYDPKEIGERSEAQILAAFLRANKVVLKPFGDNQRYDLVVEEEGRFFRIQCKTGRIAKDDGSLEFSTCSSNWNTGERRQYKGQIELFAAYCRETDSIYLVPVEAVGRGGCRLRFKQTKNGQMKGIRFAEDYLYDGQKSLSEFCAPVA